MEHATLAWSDYLYQTNNREDKESIDQLLTAIVFVCSSSSQEHPPTEFIVRVRQEVTQLIRNCCYYVTNICDLGQTNLNMLFHYNIETPPEVFRVYEANDEGGGQDKGLDQMMKMLTVAAAAKERDRPKKDDLIYPCLRRLFGRVEPINRDYLSKVYEAYGLDDDDLLTRPINQLDFHYCVLYLILTNRLQLCTEIVATYIWNMYHLLDYMFNTMRSVVRVKEQL